MSRKTIGAEQRAYFEELARRVRAGEPLSTLDVKMLAGAAEAHASTIPDEPKKRRGAPPKFNPHDAALLFCAWTRGPQAMTEGRALGKLAGMHGVSVQAMRYSIEAHRAAAGSLFDALAMPARPVSNSGD